MPNQVRATGFAPAKRKFVFRITASSGVGVLLLAYAGNAGAWYDKTAATQNGYMPAGAYAGSGQGNAAGRPATTPPPLQLQNCDDCHINVRFPTGWNGGSGFPFYGEFYSWMEIHSNGYIVLKKAGTSPAAGEAWDTVIDGSDFVPKRIGRRGAGPNTPAGLIAPWWSDWSSVDIQGPLIAAERSCAWNNSCSATGTDTQPYIVEWRGVYHLGGNTPYSFEVRLYPVSGKIEFQYGNVVGNDAWTNGHGSYAGYQRDSGTVGDDVFHDSWLGNMPGQMDEQLDSNWVFQYSPPKTATTYVHVRDFMAGKERKGVGLRETFDCSELVRATDMNINTAADEMGDNFFGGVARAVAASKCGVNGTLRFHGAGGTVVTNRVDSDGADFGLKPASQPTVIATNLKAGTVGGGPFSFVRVDSITPAPAGVSSFSMDYADLRMEPLNNTSGVSNGIFGAQCFPQYDQNFISNSKLAWYGTASTFAKPLVLVPGMDPLNKATAASYFAAFYDLLKPLIDSGYMIAVGDYGAGSVSPRCLIDEVALWIDEASSWAGDNRVSVGGISMGGVVIRNLVEYAEAHPEMYLDVSNKMLAWYSLDSPHKGANIGGSQASSGNSITGLQTLLACNANGSDAYKTLFSENARAMLYDTATTYTCATFADNSRAAMSSAWHDAYYGSFSMPSRKVPRFAIAQGDGKGPSFTRNGFGNLFHFDWQFPIPNGNWGSFKYDWFPGSTYVSGADVNSSRFLVDVTLNWKPSFMNVHSALNGSYTDTENNGAGDGNYNTLTPDPNWNATAANDSNWPHCVPSPFNACVLRNWVKSSQDEVATENCGTPPTTVSSAANAVICSTLLDAQ